MFRKLTCNIHKDLFILSWYVIAVFQIDPFLSGLSVKGTFLELKNGKLGL